MYLPSNNQAIMQAESNVLKGLPPHHGILSNIDYEIVRKKALSFSPGSPHIGTCRIPQKNYEKRSISSPNEFFISISLHESVQNMTSIEMRVQDYFHLRTAPAYSQLYKQVSNMGVSLFNKNLLNTVLKQPDCNIPIANVQSHPSALPLNSSGLSQSNVYHTPADRLKNALRPDLLNSIKSMQQNIFNRNSNPNSFQSISDAANIRQNIEAPQYSQNQFLYSRINQAANSLDIFLQFFYRELKVHYDKKQNISNLVAEHLLHSLKLSNDNQNEIFMKNLNIQGQSLEQKKKIAKKYGQCKEMCNLIDGFIKEISVKKMKNELDTHLEQYCQQTLNVLQEIYANYLREIYRYCHQIIPEEIVKKIIQALQIKQDLAINHYCRQEQKGEYDVHNSFPQPTYSYLPQNFDQGQQTFQIPLFCGKQYIDYEQMNKQKLQNHIFVINYVKNRFQDLHRQYERDRQDYMGHASKIEEQMGQIDDFVSYKRKKDTNEEIFICLQRDTEKKQQMFSQQLLDRFETNQLSDIFNEIKINEFSSEGVKYSRLFSLIHFTINIFWIKDNEAESMPFRHFFGSFRVSERIKADQIGKYLELFTKVHLEGIIRKDARFLCGELVRIQKFRKVYAINLEILQKKINGPEGYEVDASFADDSNQCLTINNLKISNSFGSIAWKQKINIEQLDFAEKTFQIGDNTIVCDCKCLNTHCQVTFFTFPKPLISWMQQYSQQNCERKLKKHIEKTEGCRLLSINWAKHHYTIQFERFFEHSDEEKDDEQEKQLKSLEESYGVHGLEIEEDDGSEEEA